MKKLKIFAVSSILFMFALVMSACSEQPAEQSKDTTVHVKTVPVTTSTVVLPIRTSGRLTSKTESKLSFKTGGIIRDIRADEGAVVKGGQLLAALDLLEIKSQVKQAELAYEKAERDLRRVENLYNDSVATLENYQDATTAKEVAETNLKIARFNLQHSQIVAPSDGKILRRLASENELTGPGNPVFLFAPSKEDMVVRVNLTDREIVAVKMGDSARIEFDAWPGEQFGAVVTQIANAADPYTGTYEVELTLDKTGHHLVSGFIARVDIIPQKQDNFVAVPVDALVDGKGREGFVWVTSNSNAVKRKIRIHRIEDNMILVSDGLNVGEQVITEGAAYVDERSEIKIEN